MEPQVALVFWTIVALRFLLPLLIPRYPLPAIIACLVLDAVDQTVFQSFGFDPPGYQGYDKAMDVFYLSVAYLSTLRNWTHRTALEVARFLFFYRLVGVLAFELFQNRALLLVFPNTFEYFFIAYELVRLRWDPARRSSRFWIVAAALIWVVIKLPQEYWIHVAQLDFTDTLAEVPWFGPAVVVGLVALLLVLWFVVRPRLEPAQWPWRIAADPLLASMGTARQRVAWWSRHGAVLSLDTLEKVVLVGLISVIFGRVLPSLRTTDLQLFVGLSVLVVLNVAWSLFLARREATLEAAWAVGLVRLATNVAFVFGADALLRRSGGDLDVVNTVFFLTLLSLIVVLHDRWRPIAATRFDEGQAAH